MPEILVIGEMSEHREALDELVESPPVGWEVAACSYAEGEERLRSGGGEHDEGWIFVVAQSDERPNDFYRALEVAIEEGPGAPVVAMVDDGDQSSAATALTYGATDVVARTPFYDGALEELFGLVEARSMASERSRSIDRACQRRGAEIGALRALAEVISSTLEPERIISYALWILSSLCRRHAVAFVEITREGSPDAQLRCVEQRAADRLFVCLNPRPHRSWSELLHEGDVLTLRERPSRRCFPGLEPLWHRFETGYVSLVPVRGGSEPVGVLILAELAEVEAPPFQPSALRAMATLLGYALGQTRLFHEINEASRAIEATHDQLAHAEKFAAVGLLAAQIAHEINNPASFVISNLSVMLDYVETVGDFLEELRERLGESAPRLLADFDELEERHEIDFLREDLDALLERSLSGMQRIHQIIRDLRYFSHDSDGEPSWVDVEMLLEATINLVRHEARYRARLERDFGGVSEIFSDANRLSQVFLNLLVNAVQAIEAGDEQRNVVAIRTRPLQSDSALEGGVRIEFEDTGVGIAPGRMDQIFEPFYTTKEPGVGTGLGLSITRDIVSSLDGRIEVSSAPGQGSIFAVEFPVRLGAGEHLRDSGSYRTPPARRRSEDSAESGM